MQRLVDTPEAMEALGRQLGENCQAGMLIYLQGGLGAGKTTLVRGFLRGRGYRGTVKSPTYTLVEPYDLDSGEVFHFDLYRMAAAEELEHIGYRDYLDGKGICLLEWPEKADKLLDAPDLWVSIEVLASGRRVALRPDSGNGKNLLLSIQ